MEFPLYAVTASMLMLSNCKVFSIESTTVHRSINLLYGLYTLQLGLYFSIYIFLFQFLSILGLTLFKSSEDTLVSLQQGFPLYSNPNFPCFVQVI